MKALEDRCEELRKARNPAELEAAGARFLQVARDNPRSLSHFAGGIALDADCGLFEVYEALAEEASRFHAFFVDELRRLLAAAEDTPDNRHIYGALEAFAYLFSPDDDPLQREVRMILRAYLDSERVALRRFATWLIGDFLKPDSHEAIRRVRGALDTDPDWRVRYMAFLSLNEGPAAGSSVRLGLADRLRVRLAGHRASDYTA